MHWFLICVGGNASVSSPSLGRAAGISESASSSIASWMDNAQQLANNACGEVSLHSDRPEIVPLCRMPFLGCKTRSLSLFGLQCVIIESRAVQEVEGGMEAVNGFVKTAPTFIAKVQVKY